jgi:RNA polymerase sigma factor (sigma-70 family)
MKAGAVDFLEKPADDQRILSAVRGALEQDRQRRSAEASAAEVAARIERLTPRERDVMHLLHQGHSIKEIASKFGISFQTVAKHRTRVLDKLGARNEAQLVRLVADHPIDE